MKNKIFLPIIFLISLEASAQTTFLNKSSDAAFYGSCFAVVRKEIQANDRLTQKIAADAMETILQYGLYVKQESPQQYVIFSREADKLNRVTISPSSQKSFLEAFVECVNSMEKVRKRQR